MIRIGIIGTGFGGTIHIPGFQAIAGVEVVGLAGATYEKTKAIADKHHVPLVFSSWQELVACSEIDAVSVVTPPVLHKPIVLSAAQHKKHIFCEKPFGMSTREATDMLRAVQKAGVVHGVDFEFRNIPGLQILKRQLEKKEIGSIRYASVSWLSGARASAGVPLGWQNDIRSGGGVLFSHGSHMLDYIEFLLSPIASVSAVLSVSKKNGVTAEDTCVITIELSSGVVVDFSLSNVLPNGSGHSIEIYGSEGSLKLVNRDYRDLAHGFTLMHYAQSSQKETSLPIPVSDSDKHYSDSRLPLFVATASEFIRGIQRKKNTLPSFEDGLRVQLVMDAIRKSNLFGKRIFIS
jgi:predicted dehydrogenase